MFCITVRCGQVVQIGDAAAVKVAHKSGQSVRLIIATALAPIEVLADGIIPPRFTTGITGQPRRILEGAAAAS